MGAQMYEQGRWNRIIVTFCSMFLLSFILTGCGPSLAQIKQWQQAGAVEPLIAALEYKGVRAEATLALLRLGRPAVEPLITALNNEDEDLREEVVKVLGKIRSPWVIDPLIAVLKNDKENAVALVGAAQVLRKFGNSRAAEPLIAGLEHEAPEVRREMARVLEKLGDFRAIKPLEKLAKNDPEPSVRQAAQEALAKIKGRQF